MKFLFFLFWVTLHSFGGEGREAENQKSKVNVVVVEVGGVIGLQ